MPSKSKKEKIRIGKLFEEEGKKELDKKRREVTLKLCRMFLGLRKEGKKDEQR